MKNNKFKSLVAIAAALICVGCVNELKEVAPAYNPEITDGEVKSVEFVIPGFVEEDGGGIQTKTTLTSKGFVWAEKDTVGIFPSKGNQIYYEMSSGAGSSSAEFDGGGWALKDEHLYSSYYPFYGNIYLNNSAIPVTYDTEVTQIGNNNSDHLGANAFMFAPETTLSNGKVTFKFWQLGSVLKPRVTLPAGTYTKLVLSTDEPIFVVSGKYDLTTGVDATSSTATYPEFVPVIVPETGGLTNKLTINLEDVTFSAETELIAYIMAAPVDVSNIPIMVTIYCGDSPKYMYEFMRTSSFVAQTNHNIRPNEKGLMSVANTSESANAAFAAGETSLSLVDITENANLDLVLPETSKPVSIIMASDEGKCAMSLSYPSGTTVPAELNIEASNGSDLVINTPESTVTLDGERTYNSVRASTASNTLIIDEDVIIGTLYLEKGNVQVYGEIMALNTDDLAEGETPTVYVYGDIQGQIDDDDVTVRRPITAVTLDQTSLELEPSETVQLVATAVPENAIYETVTWTSSNTSVATVSDEGLVTAFAPGECTITVDIDGKQAMCIVSVSEPVPAYVDLGLSVKWASCNLGATSPQEYGDYYGWGETEPYYQDGDAQKESGVAWKNGKTNGYAYPSHSLCNGAYNKLLKYNVTASYGYVDNKLILEPENDAAFVNLGDGYRLPTKEECEELMTQCTWEWTTINDVNGYVVTGKNGNSIFFPATGQRLNTEITRIGELGRIWSSSLYTSRPSSGWHITMTADDITMGGSGRNSGWSIRPVYSEDSSAGVTGISLDKTSATLLVDETLTLNTTVSANAGAVNKQVYWSSSNPAVASVDYTGKVKALSAGSATVTAKTVFGGFEANCSVTVSEPLPPYVDLGLSVKWATCNLGANNPEDSGNYYAWGETTTKTEYLWTNYKYCNGTYDSMTKYSTVSKYGDNGFVDGKIMLDPEDDAATVIKGTGWRMPTISEVDELYYNTTLTYTTVNGINGYKFQSKISGYTDNWIFIPAAGYFNGTSIITEANYHDPKDYANCWAKNIYPGQSNLAYLIELKYQGYDGYPTMSWSANNSRYVGRSIRPVYDMNNAGVTGISLDKHSITTVVSLSEQLKATLTRNVESGRTDYIEWKSSNPSVASVDYSGVVTAKAEGTATITAKSPFGGFTDECQVTVTAATKGYVDLGLSVKWASCNLGADAPGEVGLFYQWGDTQGYGSDTSDGKVFNYVDNNNNIAYKWCNGGYSILTKYVPSSAASSYGYNNFYDNKTTLELSDDAARAALGGNSRIPTNEEWAELRNTDNCTWTPCGKGYKVQSKISGYTDNWIYLPDTGYRFGASLQDTGIGYYWSSSLYMPKTYSAPDYAIIHHTEYGEFHESRSFGCNIRPVSD